MKDKGCKDMEKGKVKSCTNYSHNTVNQLYFNKINKKKTQKKDLEIQQIFEFN